ncbi:MAG: ABC transporter permease [Candidatus Latescibacteria bacterium]|jgi:peptide/nickel transport system permease protein|nr:ABC transporter permease [Candidatus Latescibacterota bacterium]
MAEYIVRRVLLIIPTLIGITLISFFVMHLAPGDPVDLFLGGAAGGEGISTDRQADLEKTRQELRRQLGLDKPIAIQYLSWLAKLVLRIEPMSDFDRAAYLVDRVAGDLPSAERAELEALGGAARKQAFLVLLRQRLPQSADELVASSFWETKSLRLRDNYRYSGSGLVLLQTGELRLSTLDFGRSFKDQQPVIKRILERIPITIRINVISLFIAYLVGIPLGVFLAVRQNTPADRVLTTGTFMLWSMPSFWVGMLLIIFFCNKEFLYWFPASGIQSLEATTEWGYWRLFVDHAHHMALPVLASCYASFAGISRFMRTSMLENLRLDYVRTARAKGLAERVVVLRHVLRNSLIPIVTILASLLPGLIAGSVFIETIFTIPGVGYLAFQSVLVRDYPMVMAIFTIGSTLSLVGILLADILLTVVDPRIQFSEIQG